MRFALIPVALLAAAAYADKIDDYVKGQMAAGKVPGMTVGIVKNGKLVSQRAYGFSDLDLNTKTTTGDLFEIGSCTKQFTAFATMMLVEDGKIALEDPISKYIPEAPDSWKNIKIRNLLYQNSGLQDYALVPGIGLMDEFDRKKWMDEMTKLPLDFEPGLTWAYSNSNYALLGWIIEKAAGMTYTQFLTERVLKPLGMTHTVFDDSSQIIPHRAHGYLNFGNQPLVRSKVGGTMTINSDGSLMSNLEDLAKWDAALRDHKLLKPSSYDAIWSPGKLNSGHTRFYGMGWNLAIPGAPAYVGHAGNSVGYSAGIARFTQAGVTVIVLCNVYAISGETVAKQVAELYDPACRYKVPSTTADPDAARTAKLRKALAALGENKADESLLDPEITAPMKTQRNLAFGGAAVYKAVSGLDYAGALPEGKDQWLEYRMTSGKNTYTAFFLWTAEDKLAQVILKGDPIVK